MKILVVSDLHFEFMRDNGTSLVADLNQDVDALVAAGDITVGERITEALDLLCCSFKNVVFITGNHEFYGTTRDRVGELVEQALAKHDNLSWLRPSKSEAYVGKQRFIGGTLWFPKHPTAPKHQLNDFKLIKNFESWVYDENIYTTSFLAQVVRPDDIVVTHHLPSYRSVADAYKGSSLNPFFVCDMEHVIKDRAPKLWIHGHTHSSCDYTIDHEDGLRTRVVCNPFGYARHEENPEFNPNLVIEI